MYQTLKEGNIISIVKVPNKEDGKKIRRSIALAVCELPGTKKGMVR